MRREDSRYRRFGAEEELDAAMRGYADRLSAVAVRFEYVVDIDGTASRICRAYGGDAILMTGDRLLSMAGRIAEDYISNGSFPGILIACGLLSYGDGICRFLILLESALEAGLAGRGVSHAGDAVRERLRDSIAVYAFARDRNPLLLPDRYMGCVAWDAECYAIGMHEAEYFIAGLPDAGSWASRRVEGMPDGIRTWASGNVACAAAASGGRLSCRILFDGVPAGELDRVRARLAAGLPDGALKAILSGTDGTAGIRLLGHLASEGALAGYARKYAPGAIRDADKMTLARFFGREAAMELTGPGMEKLAGTAIEELSAVSGAIPRGGADPEELAYGMFTGAETKRHGYAPAPYLYRGTDEGPGMKFNEFAGKAGAVHDIFRAEAAGRIAFGFYSDGERAGMEILPGVTAPHWLPVRLAVFVPALAEAWKRAPEANMHPEDCVRAFVRQLEYTGGRKDVAEQLEALKAGIGGYADMFARSGQGFHGWLVRPVTDAIRAADMESESEAFREDADRFVRRR